ncbi:MAG: ribonuclease Y [Lentisphaerae bacterium RIFOXYC12_FULL_60_16]|nr:MAG: ribonuclease Y [Lentisphaerae bacterium RIFOXYC12_FULL_60_16]OGV74132.1 MAG: ribonuclease Y [Lentisphaerae bacterium RIFOXYA12_FULL_60_10]OGV86132.1 MAG: ribonuclease Y [Lentisphaerae bacterium RIFOXYB12_FULL_60_10]
MDAWMTGSIAVAAGGLAGYGLHYVIGRIQGRALEQDARRILDEAKLKADAIRRDAELQAKSERLTARDEFEASTAARRREWSQTEERLAQRESSLDRKFATIEQKERTLDERSGALERQQQKLRERETELERLLQEEQKTLYRLAAMTPDDARQQILARVERELQADIGGMIRRVQEQAREHAEEESRRIVTMAVQRYGASHASEMTTCTVHLPGDEVKGRIIGRDGRNIRALEAATGISILIDDTPEAVVISGFDPIRREIARMALETLIADGRIHPGRIEEVVAKSTESLTESMRQAGEDAVFRTGVRNAEPELIRMLGRLKYRTSFSQNVLQHAMEVANLMGVMAGELQLEVPLARRIGLFHDIGKAVDHEVEGGHAIIGADILKRHGENAVLVNAVAAHHEEVPAESLLAALAVAADAISSSRLGARSESTGIYVQRLEKLEAIANHFPGVRKSYAIQAGREVRVLVEPEKVDDNQSAVLARDISKQIEADLQYPGQIRVVVIRETRCVEFAR